jgi:DNA (cytosine-5)-methyltransferase 1
MQEYKVADLFCGAGGTSTGAEKAIEELGGQMDLVCVNHWPVAIQTHRKNHPTARHYVEDVSVADPEELVPERYLDLLMASPECRYYSRARGGKPVHDQGRMNPWAVLRWLTSLNVLSLLVENVSEFVDWGPLLPDGRPDPKHKGEFFQSWFFAIQKAGYKAEWRMLNAADHGDATTRVRFFLIARKDGKPIHWPEPSHSSSGNGNLMGHRKKWRAAREIIDWQDAGRSLFDDEKYKKHPLSPKTVSRIAKGIEKFGGPLAPLYVNLLGVNGHGYSGNKNGNSDNENGFIVNRHGENGSDRIHSIDEPVPTATARGAGYLVEPFISPYYGVDRKHGARAHGVDDPLRTQSTSNRFGLVQPFMLPKHAGGNKPRSVDDPIPTADTRGAGFLVQPFILGKQSSPSIRDVDQPIPTVTADGAQVLVEPTSFVFGQHSGSTPRNVDKPIPTIMGGHAAGIRLVKPCLVRYNRTGGTEDLEKPLPTVMAKDRFALTDPVIIPYRGEREGQEPRAHSVNEPAPTITEKNGFALATPLLVEVNHDGDGSRAQSVEEPLGTITSRRGTAVVIPFIIQTDQTGGNGAYVRSVEDPLPTLVTKANTCLVEAGLVEVVLTGADGQEALDPGRLVLVNGELHVLDIRFRMLSNLELARAMGFTDEETTYEFVGNKSDVTRQIGNAVPVHLAKALVKAILE